MLRRLNRPAKIQDFLNELPMNFEEDGETCYSPRTALRTGKAHCMEAAMLAAVALRLAGDRPLILDLESTAEDDDHVVAVFQRHGFWGAIGKTNHAVLRYREPVYRTIRELVMSFFHEYFLNKNGKKTLRRYSRPINLARFDRRAWMTSAEDVWFVPEFLTEVHHYSILMPWQVKGLRRAEPIEVRAGRIVDEIDPLGRDG